MRWLIYGQWIWFSAWRSPLSQFPFAGTERCPVLTESRSEGTGLFFLGLFLEQDCKGREDKVTETDKKQWHCLNKDSIYDWVPWWLITLKRREGKRIKSNIIPTPHFFPLNTKCSGFISSKLLFPFFLCFSVSDSACLSCNVSLLSHALSFPGLLGFQRPTKWAELQLISFPSMLGALLSITWAYWLSHISTSLSKVTTHAHICFIITDMAGDQPQRPHLSVLFGLAFL